MKNTKITVLTRTKNSSNTVFNALKSVYNQSYSPENIEIILIDDGSSDDTVNVVATCFPHITVLTTQGIGAIKTLNLGLQHIRTPYFTIVDSDDELPEHALEILSRVFATDQQVAGVYGDYKELFQNGDSRYVSTSSNIFTTVAGGILFRTDLVKEMGGYDESLFFPEYDLLIKLLEKYRVAHVAEDVYHYFRHPNSLTADKQKVVAGIAQLTAKYGTTLTIRDY